MRDECTTITISHRLSSTASSETIVVLDDGRVVGVGNHRTVMQECSLYRTLAELQDLEQMVEAVDRVGGVLTHPPVREARVSMAAR
jgi:ABC-type protease/lipase transport system fused ATPase/permease subunit